MMDTSIDCNECLKSFSKKDFSLMIRHLEKDGYFFDEHEGINLGSVLMEKCHDEIERRLRSHGYNGGQLFCAAKFYPTHGAVYALFDSEKIDYEPVYKALDKWVDLQEQLQNYQ
jgi:hypothetical protein